VLARRVLQDRIEIIDELLVGLDDRQPLVGDVVIPGDLGQTHASLALS
jgi:hypothetical protein